MLRKGKKVVAAGALGLLIGLGGLVWADHKIEGTYDLKRWGFGAGGESSVWITKVSEGNYELIRKDSEGVVRGTMVANPGDSWMKVDFKPVAGATGALDSIGSDNVTTVANGWYKVTEANKVYGYFNKPDADGNSSWVFEYGDKVADRPAPDAGGDDSGGTLPDDPEDDSDDDHTGGDDALQVLKPASGTLLVGQAVALELKPAGAELTIDGPATRDGDSLKITGAGEITLTAKSNGAESAKVTLKAIAARVTEVTVLDAISITDAKPPHFTHPLGEDAKVAVTPAAIFKDTKLRLQLKIQAEEDLSQVANVGLTANGSGVAFNADVQLKGLASGQLVTVESAEILNDGVAINEVSVQWELGGQKLNFSELRVYTSYKAPIKNISNDRYAANTVHHFEKACEWARGASQNIGNGRESIGYQIDNYMRHYVHWNDLNGYAPAVPDYPEGSEPPKNYGDLSGGYSISNGSRGVSSLYYPPLEPDEDYEKYENYRNNFGWWVLDNPNYTGGRCNQQAALVCGILGTVGIKAEILYLHRTARGKRTGRPIRHYFYAAGGGGPWNFHGVCLADMDDGSQWIYDGSFSSPPRRKNGTREWAENEGGPFIQSFATWYYDDWRGGKVPENDIPPADEWNGIPLASGN